MMIDEEYTKGIVATLRHSVQSGLNASLTPEDSLALLVLIHNLTDARADLARTKRHGKKTVEGIVSNICDNFSEAAKKAFRDFVDDLQPYGQPGSSKRRKRKC
jgi:hypothetical protein